MDLANFLIQLLNSVQYGLLLFMLAAGLTLIFGIMGVVNLAHGSFYMLGAYLAWWLSSLSGSLTIAILGGSVLAVLFGLALERLLFRHFYQRDHLDQVLLTFGLIYIFEEMRSILWGDDVHGVKVPELLSASIPLTENLSYPVYRLFISGVCIALALGLYLLISKTRVGMKIRAGAFNREMTEALGVNVQGLFTAVFVFGAALCALAGGLLGPLLAVQVGMGESVLILAFVVIIIGGIGSIRGALVGSLIVGTVDTLGRALLPTLLRATLPADAAATLGPALASILIYLLMAAILFWRPQGLFPARA